MRVLSTALLAATAISIAHGASADCVSTNSPSQDGDVVRCSGLDTDGFNQEVLGTGNLDEIDLRVRNGAVVTNADDTDARTIELDDDAEIVNRGTILSEDADAIEFDNDGFLRNLGLISGGDEAIQTGADATIINGATGTIQAADKGIVTDDEPVGAGDGLTLINRGLIETVDEAVEATDDVQIENRGFGRITSIEDDAVQFGTGLVINGRNAEISSTGGDAIDIDAGIIENRGLIETTASGEAGVDIDAGPGDVDIINSGTIAGAFGILTDDANTGAQTVVNSGTISAFEAQALYLGEGEDSLVLRRGSEILGDADFGAGNDTLAVLSRQLTFSPNALLDGGEGFDTVELLGFRRGALTTAVYEAGVFTFGLTRGAFDWTVQLTNWESFSFRNGDTVSAADLADQLAPIPLPAGGALLLSGLGVLAIARRRRG